MRRSHAGSLASLLAALLGAGCSAVLGIDFDEYRAREDAEAPGPFTGDDASQGGSGEGPGTTPPGTTPPGTTAGTTAPGDGTSGGATSGGSTNGSTAGSTSGSTAGSTSGSTGGRTTGSSDGGSSTGGPRPDGGDDGGPRPPGFSLLPCEPVGATTSCAQRCRSVGLGCAPACRVPFETRRYAGIAAATADCRTTSPSEFYPIGTCEDAFTTMTIAIQCCCGPAVITGLR